VAALIADEPVIRNVFVYRLVEPSALERRASTLAGQLAVAMPIEPWFEALPGGGFRWLDEGHAAGPGRGAPAAAPADARKVAAAYLRAVNGAAERDRSAQGMTRAQLPDPFPLDALRPSAVVRVPDREGGRGEHWLTRWTVELPCTPDPDGARVPVAGAEVEVRVGRSGAVIAVVSRVRPWQGALTRPALPWMADDGEPDHDHDHGAGPTGQANAGSGADDDPPIVYVSDHPYEPQRFLAPCWVIEPEDEEDHHARRLWPASDHTILPEIFVEDQRGEATVWAQVLAAGQRTQVVEHGPEWRLRWSVADLQRYVAGERQVSDGTSAQLPGPGIYQVELEVEHAATGAIRSTQRQVAIARPPTREERKPPLLQS
jgi:hypothetical protein